MMIQYSLEPGDIEAIVQALDSLGDSEIIDHGTARAIAVQYVDSPIGENFLWTGELPANQPDPATTLIYALFDGCAEDPEYGLRFAWALEAYIEDRGSRREYAPIPEWSEMWVGRPHPSERCPECGGPTEPWEDPMGSGRQCLRLDCMSLEVD